MNTSRPAPEGIGRELDVALGALPRELPPASELWPRIAARLEPREAPRRRWAWQLAAAVMLIAASSLLTAVVMQRYTVTSAAVPALTAAPADLPGFASATGRAAYAPGADYLSARRQMLAVLAARLEGLPPQTRVQIAGNLAEMRRAAEDIGAALARQPGDPLLQELLLNVYQDELAMIASVSDLTDNAVAVGRAVNEGVEL